MPFQTQELTPYPAGSNPFHHDLSNMGTRIAANIMIMHSTHDDQIAEVFIVVNTNTGERLRIIVAK